MDERIRDALLFVIESLKQRNERLDDETEALLRELTDVINADTERLEETDRACREYLEDTQWKAEMEENPEEKETDREVSNGIEVENQKSTEERAEAENTAEKTASHKEMERREKVNDAVMGTAVTGAFLATAHNAFLVGKNIMRRETDGEKGEERMLPFEQLREISQSGFDKLKTDGFPEGCLDDCLLKDVVVDGLPERFTMRYSRFYDCRINGRMDILVLERCVITDTEITGLDTKEFRIENGEIYDSRIQGCKAELASLAGTRMRHSNVRNCSVGELDMTGTVLDSTYFDHSRPGNLIGAETMKVTIGGATPYEVENYMRSVNAALSPDEGKVQVTGQEKKQAVKLR